MAFWLVMMGLLVYREVLVPRMHAHQFPPRLTEARDLWMGIYSGGECVGFVNSRTTPETRGTERGVRLHLNLRMALSIVGFRAGLFLGGTAWLSAEKGLSDFDFTFRSGRHRMRVTGAVAEGALDARLETGGESLPFTFPISDDLLLSAGMGMPSLDVRLLEPGQQAYVDAFDPTTMSMGKARLECVGTATLTVGGELIETFVIATTIGGITTRAWVTAGEEVVRAETPFGFTLEKISPQEALTPIEPSEKANVVRALAIMPSGLRPWRDATMMRVRFSGVDETHMPPSDAVQSRAPSGYVITVPEAPKAGSGAALPEAVRERFLQSDAFIPAHHEKIAEAAHSVVGEATEPWQQALRLHDWAFTHVKKVPVISIPSALDVLHTLEGDCNEHTVLFTALARAMGIPTRIAIGVAWSEELEGFGYHAWPEVHVGQWIPMDPTFGQPVADATHIKLLNGSIDQWTQLLPYVGQLQIEVLEVQ